MKGIDIFCASQAATAICLSMQEASSSSSSSVIQLGGGSISASRLIDRYNPIIRDSRRVCDSGRSRPLQPHSSDRPLISPKPKNMISNKKITCSKPSKETKKRQNEHKSHVVKRKSSWSCTKPSEYITPPSSSRYLLNEKDLVDALSDYNNDPVLNSKSCHQAVKVVANESSSPKRPSSSSCSGDQVVVLRVSLHCRGCEKKMRKHLSRMEGVTSFNIDFVAKKVTVTGNVTPLEVLASISKVKNAQLWPPSVPSSTPSTIAELKNEKQLIVSDGKLENISRSSPVFQLL